mgnify:CR=1 FL=1
MAQSPSSSNDSSDHESPDYVDRILKGSGSVFSGSMVGKVVGFTLNLVMARGFGDALFGLYSLGLTLLRVVQSVATLGLQNGIVRFAAPSYERGETAEVKGTFLASGGLGILAGITIGVVFFTTSSWLANAVFNEPEMKQVIEVFACGLPFYVLTYLLSRMARALGRMQADVLLDSILQPAIFLVLAGGVLGFGYGFDTALYAFVLSTLLAAGGGLYALYCLFPPLLSSLPPSFAVRRLLRFSLPIIGVTLAGVGLTYTDRIMLGILSTSTAVGLYEIAARLAQQLRFVLSAITAAFSPIISDLYHNDRVDALSELYSDTVRWILLFTLPICLLMVAFAPEVMSLFGPGFREGAGLLQVLAPAYLIVAGVGSVGQMLQMTDHQDAVLGINTSMALMNIVLNWLLIRIYGPIGAALATGLTQGLGNLFQVALLYHFTGLQPFRRGLWKILVAAGAAGLVGGPAAVLLAAPLHWIVGIPLLLLSYTGATFALGLHPKDQSIAESLWDRLHL